MGPRCRRSLAQASSYLLLHGPSMATSQAPSPRTRWCRRRRLTCFTQGRQSDSIRLALAGTRRLGWLMGKRRWTPSGSRNRSVAVGKHHALRSCCWSVPYVCLFVFAGRTSIGQPDWQVFIESVCCLLY